MKLLQNIAAAVLAATGVLAIPSELDASLFARAVGDHCSASEGTGSCQKTSACKGISYPQALCPKDPDDVQVPSSNSLYSGESLRLTLYPCSAA